MNVRGILGVLGSVWWLILLLLLVAFYRLVLRLFGAVIIPGNAIGVVRKRWVLFGSNRTRAVEEVRLALVKLAANPRQATCPPGLFEARPIHRFSLNADGVRRDVQVCFCYDQDDKGERTIIITDFIAVVD